MTPIRCGGRVGLAVDGLVTETGELRYGPNLGVERLPLRALLEDQLSVPVVVYNDAEAASWAEAAVGVARDSRSVAMLTLGTGVGGALLDTGHFLRRHGFGGELAATSSPSVLPGTFYDIDVSRSARKGDAFAVEVVLEACRWPDVGFISIVNAVDPELVVLGRRVTNAVGQIRTPPAIEMMRTRLMGAHLRRPTDLVTAELGDNAGMLGAGLLALDAAARAHAFTSTHHKETAP